MTNTRDQLVSKQNMYCVLHVQCTLSYNRLFPRQSYESSIPASEVLKCVF